MDNMISWTDYQGVEGFGSTSQQEIDALNKALTVGADINAPASVTAGDGFALRVESLDRTLKNQTYRMDHIVFWRDVTKLPAWNTVEEYNELQGYGENADAGWIAEGDLPETDDASFERKYSVVKFLGTTRRVSHQATLIKPAHQNIVAQETINGTMHILKMMEKALWKGDSSLSSLQFDGYEKLIEDNSPATNVIDLRGLPLSEDSLTDAALTIMDAPNYGTPTHMYLNPKNKSDLVKSFFPKERHDTFKGSGGMVGLDVKGFTSPAGDVLFRPDTFIDDGGAPVAAGVGDATKRPGTPVISTAVTTPAAALSQFAADDAGNYYMYVVACNRYGKSIPVDVGAGAAIAVVAGDEITFGVTPSGGVTVEWYEVYRTLVGAASLATTRQVLRITNSTGALEETIHEYNDHIPYCYSAYLMQQNVECMAFKQLAPLVRIALATIDTSIRWAQVLYGVPQLYTPGKVVLFQNIGRSSGYVGAP